MAEITRLTLWVCKGSDAAVSGCALRTLSLLACSVLLCGNWPGIMAVAAPVPEDESVLLRAKEAVNAAMTNLRRGTAKGSFRLWLGPNRELVQSASFVAAFDGARQYYRVHYEPLQQKVRPQYDRRVVVCDGSEVFVAEFSEHIHPLGAEGIVNVDSPGAVYAATQGLSAGLKRLAVGIFPLAPDDKHTVRIEKLPNGHFLGTYEAGPGHPERLEIPPEFGYRCVRTEMYDHGKLQLKVTAAFEQYGDLWFVANARSAEYSGGEHSETSEWKLDEFEPNVTVSPELFTLSALELPPGARIIDRRPPEGYRVTDPANPPTFKATIYRLPDTEGQLEQKQADRLVEQVEALPQMYTQPPPPASRWRSRLWGVVISVLGIAAITVLCLVSRKRQRPEG